MWRLVLSSCMELVPAIRMKETDCLHFYAPYSSPPIAFSLTRLVCIAELCTYILLDYMYISAKNRGVFVDSRVRDFHIYDLHVEEMSTKVIRAHNV